MVSRPSKSEFLTLVHANHQTRHAAVLCAAADLFAGNARPTREDLLHFEELSLRLWPKLNLTVRTKVALLLSEVPHLPKAVALAIAKDTFCVAAPVLKNYQRFSENDLLSVLSTGSADHAIAISTRADVTDKVAIALSRTERMANEHEASNASPDHPSSAAEEDAGEDPKPLENEMRVLKELAQRLATNRKPPVRKEKPDHQPATRPALDVSLKTFLELDHAAILGFTRESEQKASAVTHDPATLLREARQRANKAAEFSKLARTGNRSAFIARLSDECGLREQDCEAIIRDVNGFALALCLKALTLPIFVANEAFILLNSALGEDSRQIYLLDWYYNQISPPGARLFLESWKAHGSGMVSKQQVAHHVPHMAGKTHGERVGANQEKPERSISRTAHRDTG